MSPTTTLPLESILGEHPWDYNAPNIPTMITSVWQRRSGEVALRWADADDSWHDVTGAEAHAKTMELARGLIALGVTAGQPVGIMAKTRMEWTLLDVALWLVGAVPIPIYDTSSRDQVEWITADAQISLLFVETDANARVAREVVASQQSPLTDVRIIDEGALEHLVVLGADVDARDVAARTAGVGRSDIATIIYTSGTTGRPKGCVLTHGHFVVHVGGIQRDLSEVLYQDGASTVLFLTLAHVLARIIEIALLATGVVIAYCPDATKLVTLIGSAKPTLIIAVPRVFEKVYSSAEARAAAAGRVKIFRWAAKQSVDYSMALDSPAGPSLPLRLRHRIADTLVLGKIAAVLGGNASWAVSGSAPLGARLAHFYRGVGLTILEGYGLTETTAASHVNRPHREKIGTVGQPLPGVEVRIADDGEILMRAETIFTQYLNNPEATAAAFDDGWLLTGDVGTQDAEGYLTITGRKKEIIVTAGGKNVAPAVLEERVRAYPLVAQCVVVGDGQPFIGALVTLDRDVLPGWLAANGLPEMTVEEAIANQTVREHVDRAVERANQAVSRAESIRKYTLLADDFTIDNGYLTPSMKLKRTQVIRDFAAVIGALYAAAPAD